MNINIRNNPCVWAAAAIYLACSLLLMYSNVAEAREVRSCQLNIYFMPEQKQIGTEWVDLTNPPPYVSAGHLNFTASAPAGSPNRARMRASKKAEKCINDYKAAAGPAYLDSCRDKSSSSSYEEEFGVGRDWDLTPMMQRAICADIYRHSGDSGFAGLTGIHVAGHLHANIDGDRCCKHSSKKCTYAYGINRVRIIQTFHPVGGIPGDNMGRFGLTCQRRIIEIPTMHSINPE